MSSNMYVKSQKKNNCNRKMYITDDLSEIVDARSKLPQNNLRIFDEIRRSNLLHMLIFFHITVFVYT